MQDFHDSANKSLNEIDFEDSNRFFNLVHLPQSLFRPENSPIVPRANDSEMKTNNYLDSVFKVFNKTENIATPLTNPNSAKKSNLPGQFQPVKKGFISRFGEKLQQKREVVALSGIDDIFKQFNGDFQSDQEEEVDFVPVYTNSDVKLQFMQTGLLDKNNKKAETALDFKMFTTKAESRFETNNIYVCEVCGKKFKKHAALGGHMSKIHPKKSRKFEERMQIYALRQGERDKRKFLQNLK